MHRRVSTSSAPPPEPDVPAACAPAAAPELQSGAERGGHHGPFHSHCENCGAALHGPWCHACGQHDFEFHRSFRHVALEALESFFHFDGTFFRSTLTLLFKPGRLTARFHAGKRAAQMPPFRLYVFVAFVFFLVMHWIEPDPVQVDASVGGSVAEATPVNASPAAGSTASAAATEFGDELDDAPPWVRELGARLSDPDERRELGERFLAKVPKVLLVCLPLFALLTRLLFRRARDWVYLKHLVLALHFHTFIYLWTLLMVGLGWIAAQAGPGLEDAVETAGNLWLIAYPPLMLRHLFSDTWAVTLFKSLQLGLAYSFVLVAAFAAAGTLVLMS